MEGAYPAGAADAVDGVLPKLCAAPRSAGEVAELLRHAEKERLAVIARGAGTKLGWGTPPERADLVLQTRRLDRVIEHAAADLVVRAESGVRLSDLQAQLAGASQRLSLDPPEPGATLGGIVAAAASGPRRHRFGAPRDLLLGITVALADGTVAKAGGKVVKNVAGYDLGKLFTGSLGTLGVIVELAFRLHPLPQARAWIVAQLETPEAATLAVLDLLGSTLVPSAVELDWTPGEPVRLGILFEGRLPGVEAQAEAARTLLGQGVVNETAFDVAAARTAPALELQIAALPADLTVVLNNVRDAARERGLTPRVSGRAGLGVLLASFGNADAEVHAGVVAALRRRLDKRASVVIRRASVDVKRRADVFGDAGDALPLMRRVKQRFDPANTLAPGRFVGGI